MKFLLLYILLLFGQTASGNLNRKLRAYLKANVKNVVRMEFKIVRKPRVSKIIIDRKRKFSLSGKFAYVPVILVNGKKKSQGYLTLRLKLFKRCYVALRNLNHYENLSPGDFTERIMDVTTLAKQPVTDLSKITQFRTIRYLKSGEILFKEDIQEIPLIYSGQAVEGRYISGRVMIQLRVVAEQNGWKNKIIHVRGPHNKIFNAKVIGKQLVLLME